LKVSLLQLVAAILLISAVTLAVLVCLFWITHDFLGLIAAALIYAAGGFHVGRMLKALLLSWAMIGLLTFLCIYWFQPPRPSLEMILGLTTGFVYITSPFALFSLLGVWVRRRFERHRST
jgi:hypothetical protein